MCIILQHYGDVRKYETPLKEETVRMQTLLLCFSSLEKFVKFKHVILIGIQNLKLHICILCLHANAINNNPNKTKGKHRHIITICNLCFFVNTSTWLNIS